MIQGSSQTLFRRCGITRLASGIGDIILQSTQFPCCHERHWRLSETGVLVEMMSELPDPGAGGPYTPFFEGVRGTCNIYHVTIARFFLRQRPPPYK